MDFTRECLYFTAKSIASTLYGLVLWASNFPSPPVQASKYDHNIARRTNTSSFSFIVQNTPPRIIHAYMVPPPAQQALPPPATSVSSSSSLFGPSTLQSISSWSTSSMGDLIGSESGVYTSALGEDMLSKEFDMSGQYCRQVPKKIKKKTIREYPPPIPSMARTGNLIGRMPWVLNRDYVDGRLIVTMHEVSRHEYFEAERSNGRLTLTLTPLDRYMDDDVNVNETIIHEEEEEVTTPPFSSSLPQSCCRDDGWCAAYERMCFTYAGEPMNFGHIRGSDGKTDSGSVNDFNFRRAAPMASVM